MSAQVAVPDTGPAANQGNGHGNGRDIVIDVHGLTKSFDGRTVVRNLSMQVRRG